MNLAIDLLMDADYSQCAEAEKKFNPRAFVTITSIESPTPYLTYLITTK